MKDVKPGSLIRYNYLYSNENDKIGIVCSLKKDSNFSYIVYILLYDQIVQVPYSIMEIKKIE